MFNFSVEDILLGGPLTVSIIFRGFLIKGLFWIIFIGGFALNLGDIYINSLKKSLNKIAFFHRTRKEVTELVELGINDDMDCLIGVGLLSQKQYAETRQ